MIDQNNSTYDYRLLVEDDLIEAFSDDISKPGTASSSSSSLRSLRIPWHVFRIPFRHAIRIVLALPFGAFVFAIFWAICTDYDKAVNVLCVKEDNRKVKNYLPSLSAAIGDFPISQAIWTLCIILHTPPRFLFGSMYLQYFETIVPSTHYKWAYTAWVLSVLELIGLVGLSIVTSRRNLPFHATCFAIFLISSELYMLFQCFLQSSRTKSHGPNAMESKSLRIKKFLTKLIIVCTIVMFIVYVRHETHCEAGVYTIFAFLEYIVIFSIMGAHGCAYFDFYDKMIIVDLCRPFVSPNTGRLSWKV